MDINNSHGPREDASVDDEAKARRDFLKKTAKGAATVPAVALLLAASHKQAFANHTYGGGGGCGGGSIL